ncbi:polynucleotide kinase 3'-phosphatase [Brevipalpus obovatus]|uniref:polynucleotide kinase 3'-phosphatase n=1 Tax=Brevipalpus obovatus TaxID=246614 RepID=UPI003D9F7457
MLLGVVLIIILFSNRVMLLKRFSVDRIKNFRHSKIIYQFAVNIDKSEHFKIGRTDSIIDLIVLHRSYSGQVDAMESKKNKLELVEDESSVKKQCLSNKSSPSSGADQECQSYWDEDTSTSVLVYKYMGGGKPNSKIASFDFDGTLVKVKSGAKFPRDGSDWLLFNNKIPSLIQKFGETHRFVIFSNQMGVSTGAMKVNNVKERVEGCLNKIGVPCTAFFALERNPYRKPSPGMLTLFQESFNDGISVDKPVSFYVGDAAGRKTAFNKDHSSSDLEFAVNAELPFSTPEQFMAGARPRKVDRSALLGLKR